MSEGYFYKILGYYTCTSTCNELDYNIKRISCKLSCFACFVKVTVQVTVQVLHVHDGNLNNICMCSMCT